MGRWCEVKCNCPNDGPVVPGSRNLIYNCEHNSVYLEFWPGDLFSIGYAIEEAFGRQSGFEIFTKIGNWRLYEGEHLSLSPSDIDLWEIEIEQLKHYLSGEEYMGWRELRKWNEYFEKPRLLYGDVDKTLEDGLKLIRASREMNRPIEFFW
ncbi:MAG: hypothetical protein AB7U82_23280 [Blastocatellales bacterium]